MRGLREVQLLASGNDFVQLLPAMAIVLVGMIYEPGTHHKSKCDQYGGMSVMHKNRTQIIEEESSNLQTELLSRQSVAAGGECRGVGVGACKRSNARTAPQFGRTVLQF